MSTIAHVLEEKGLATLTIGSVRPHLEAVRPPRGLMCDFPLGRPLGRPDDVAFQRRVLARAFGLLAAESGPVLEEFGETLSDVDATPLACPLPPRVDPDAHPAVDEARALRAAYDRAVKHHGNRIGTAREIEADAVPDAVAAFTRVEQGTPWQDAGIPGNPMRVAQDIRGYYQTAALALSEHTPAAWAGEKWFYDETETGKLMLACRTKLKESGAPQPLWFYLSPGDRPA